MGKQGSRSYRAWDGYWHSRTVRRLIHEPLDVELDGTVPYRVGRELLVPEQPGVYLIHDLRGVLYVGRSLNLRRRFDEHYWRPWNRLLAAAIARPVGQLNFSWCCVDYPEQVALERSLIRGFTPPCNGVLHLHTR